MTKIRSARGRIVNMDELRKKHANTPAIGNANMNARGDIIGKGGKIIKTRKEIVDEYYSSNPNSVNRVAIDRLKLSTPYATPNNNAMATSSNQTADDLTFMTPQQIIEEAEKLKKQNQAKKPSQVKPNVNTEKVEKAEEISDNEDNDDATTGGTKKRRKIIKEDDD
ncbi:MAG: hypothetical protein WC284_12625 [Candidimonas sp.]